MRRIKFLRLLIFTLLTLSCSDKKETETQSHPAFQVNPEAILKIDLNQDLSNKSLQELRLLRNSFYARQGYCFMQADLRGYYTAHMPGYDSIMTERFWKEDENPDSVPPIKFSKEENVFIQKIEALEKAKKQENYIVANGVKIGNAKNIINLFQFNNLSTDFMDLIAKNNFAIVPTENNQLFQIYESSDYKQIPNFVTTDLYLQLYHMYFSYLLKTVETTKFIPMLTELTEGMYAESMSLAKTSSDSKIREKAEYAATFYAIPYYVLSGNKKTIPEKYAELFETEISNIADEKDAFSEFLDFKDAYFPYSLYKPRGHYTRSETLKKYFKAMMWLQTAIFCREKSEQLSNTIFMAHLLNTGKSKADTPLLKLYNAIYKPIVFLIGEPDNLSINDIVDYLSKNNINDISSVLQSSTQKKVDAELQSIVKTRNKIKPKIEISCPDKINFMPQRYLFDNEILQNLVDVEPNAERAFPKGLDIFAALGNLQAEEILKNEDNDATNWKDYPKELNTLKQKFSNYKDWDKTVYNKWMQTLLLSQKIGKDCPAFMQTEAWARKNLNTSLASWTDLKHDAILYGEQPEAAECGGGGPPDPITVGYVEPNVPFWKNMLELLALTESTLKNHGLFVEDIASTSNQLKESIQFMLTASEKELRKEKLTEQEYKSIEIIGSSIEYLTLSVVDEGLQYWSNVQGPDKSVAVVADVYTRNIPGCKKNGILHEGVGNANEIYVVVEIEGYLYLTMGATFSYYEFVMPLGTRLTDEEWQKKIESKKDLPPIPNWLKGIILPAEKAPVPDEKVFYSSGC